MMKELIFLISITIVCLFLMVQYKNSGKQSYANRKGVKWILAQFIYKKCRIPELQKECFLLREELENLKMQKLSFYLFQKQILNYCEEFQLLVSQHKQELKDTMFLKKVNYLRGNINKEQIDHLYQLIDSLDKERILYLKKHFYFLTKTELNFLILMKCKCSDDEIKQFMSISFAALKQRKNRMKRKLLSFCKDEDLSSSLSLADIVTKLFLDVRSQNESV